MEQKTILLNGGRLLDVAPVEEADDFLVELLGPAPSRPAVPTLRVVDQADGQRCVGVFIGSTHVGFLAQAPDTELVATLQACEVHGAVARARGNLIPSWDRPGKVAVKVNLAEPDGLLGDPAPGPPGPGAFEAPDQAAPQSLAFEGPDHAASESPAFAPVSLMASLEDEPYSPGRSHSQQSSSSLDDAGPVSLAASLDDATPTELSAGYAEEWPDWPPVAPNQTTPTAAAATAPMDDPIPPLDPAPMTDPAPSDAPAPVFRTSVFGGPPIAVTPASAAEPDLATASPQALLSTRSAWLGGTPATAQPPQAGWLAAPSAAALGAAPAGTVTMGAVRMGGGGGPASQENWLATRPAGGAPGQPPVAAMAGVGAAGVSTGNDGYGAGWTSTAAPAQPLNQTRPAHAPSQAKTWIIGALAFLVMATLSFVVWKTVFATQTFTDPEYGYSFSYPGRWDFEDSGVPLDSFSSMTGSGVLLDGAAAGHGDDQSLEDFAVVGVVVLDTSTLGLGDPSQWGPEFEANLAQAASMDPGMAIVEPLLPTTVGGVSGYQATITLSSGSMSVTMSFCFLVDGSVGYMAVAMSPESDWSGNQKTFDQFFDSFKPGGAQM